MIIVDDHLQRLPVKIKTMDEYDEKKDTCIGYYIIKGEEFVICEGKLDEIREFALNNGLLGILL